ncbi:KAP family P-loop NTPase fold protein [Acinetobacter oleivorans]|uniref:KAP family P-loop NTPase fold protein n=2 Tax=Acinetobacter oleivorans TaxID=1148157 RepID=UPI00190281CC|nr:P-loop NTPase fold protein [Acinetobacter oleivorans]MBJ8496977.1 AAA family ATPase [Acinetobacter oleivorans]
MADNYTSDSPVFKHKDDKFNRWLFSKRIADVIANRNDSSSIVIGLYGAWGNGKTSVLNFIEESLTDNQEVLCIKFNPWRFGTEEELLKAFFLDIAHAIEVELITKTDKAKDAVKSLAPAITSIFGAAEVGQAISSFIPSLELQKLKERIESELEKAQKRVLILIDDVDRLEKSEIHALFRLVKLTADFKHTAYILAFDKDIVASSLQDRYANSSNNAGEAFLEKIIQVPLHLPLIDQSVLIKFCFQGVDEALKVAGIELSQNEANDYASKFTRYFGSAVTTPRKAKLYGNILLFSLPILKGEVDVVELMLIEAIRVFYQPIYDLLRINKDMFSGTFSQSRFTNNESDKEKIKQLLDRAINLCINVDKEKIISLLRDLFPKINSCYQNMYYGSEWYVIWEEKQKVCAPNYYSRYFTYSITEDDISDITIKEILNQCELWQENFDLDKNPLNKFLNNENAERLISKLRTRAVNLSEKISFSLSIAIAQKSNQLPYTLKLFDWFTPVIQGAMLISDLVQNIKQEERLPVVQVIIDHITNLDFIFDLLSWVKKYDEEKPEETEVFSSLDMDELSKYVVGRIKKDLSSNINIIETVPRNLPLLFRLLNEYIQPNFVNELLIEILPTKPELLISIIKPYLGIAEGGSRSGPHRSDLKFEQYKQITKQININILIDVIEQNIELDSIFSESFPEQYDNLEDNDLIFIKQLYWLYKNRNNQKDLKDDS